MKKSLFLLMFLLCIFPTAVLASQITIFDNQKYNKPKNIWHSLESEDQEVEPGATASQSWDLDGIYLENQILSIVRGGDFVHTKSNIGFGCINNTTPNHYRFSKFDLSPLLGSNNNSFVALLTQKSGNDDSIMGQAPEPATMILLGMGLLSISAIARKLPL